MVYAIACDCSRRLDLYNTERGCNVLVLEARSVEEAEGIALNVARNDYPSSNGWGGHHTYAMRVDPKWRDKL